MTTSKNFAFALLLSTAMLPSPALAKSGAAGPKEMTLAELAAFKWEPQEVRDKIDRSLMENPYSVSLNFLSGLVYDSQSTAGSEGRQLARVGYLSALRVDPTYWPSNYQLGLLAMEDGDAVAAVRMFTAAAFYAQNEPAIFYAMARASYCAGDAANASVALARAVALKQPAEKEELVTAALVAAANGDRASAEQWLGKLGAQRIDAKDSYLGNRVAQLLDHPDIATPVAPKPATEASQPAGAAPVAPKPATEVSQPAGAAPVAPKPATEVSQPASATPVAPKPATEASQPAGPTPASSASNSVRHRRAATVDVVVIRRKEAFQKSSGVNLMDALTLQFDSTLINSQRNAISDRLSGTSISDQVTTLNSVNLTVPAVTYSLNIANAAGSQSSIESRPTLIVYNGQTSKIFSGGTLTYSTNGDLSSQSYTKEVGTTLSVTPKFNDSDDTVTLTISVGLETFSTTGAGTFKESVTTDKSSTDITAELRFGDTVIVSGGRFQNLETNRSMTPFLGAMPLFGNLFKRRASVYQTNDLLVLLSLRRESGGADTGSAEERDSMALLANDFWRKVGITPPDNSTWLKREDHRPYYLLDNPGRSFSKAYMDQIGLDVTF